MKREYYKYYSRILQRDMEGLIYGDGGQPVLAVPCQGGRFFEMEDMGLLSVYAPYVERGEMQIITLDSLDNEGFASEDEDKRKRIERHEQWIQFVAQELIPFFHEKTGNLRNLLAEGISLGAGHAATLYFRFPQMFVGLLALSGVYSSEYFFGDYHDDLTYMNAPEQFLANLPLEHPSLSDIRKGKIILCVGRGDWEFLPYPSTQRMAEIFRQKDIPAWVDIWGEDVAHDWCWWLKQTQYFLPYLLKELNSAR